MRLLEYQAKEIFAEFGIKIPKGKTSKDVEQGRKDAQELGYPFVIKSQVPVGGRGKAGAIQKCNNDDAKILHIYEAPGTFPTDWLTLYFPTLYFLTNRLPCFGIDRASLYRVY